MLLSGISWIIIHQIFSLVHDWSKRVTWPNIPQLKLGNIREYSPIFKTARVAKKIWRIINTIASIWGGNMLRYLSLDIICSSKLTVFLELCPRKTVSFSEQIMSADKYPRIFSRQVKAIVYIIWNKRQLLVTFNNSNHSSKLNQTSRSSARHRELFKPRLNWRNPENSSLLRQKITKETDSKP